MILLFLVQKKVVNQLNHVKLYLNSVILQNLITVKNEIKTPVSFRTSKVIYGSSTLETFKDSDLLYVVCDGNNAGEAYPMLAPISLFRNGPSFTRVVSKLLDADGITVSLGLSGGDLTVACSTPVDIYLRYACVISSKL